MQGLVSFAGQIGNAICDPVADILLSDSDCFVHVRGVGLLDAGASG